MLLKAPDLVVAVMDHQYMRGILIDNAGTYGPAIIQQNEELFLMIEPNGEEFGNLNDIDSNVKRFNLDMTPLN